ncbi:5' nucleotidase, NT5C type [Mucilaginibacter mali]|nr:5'(3')-deoxyribonucleotidase [Mucilaginibacter mali]
MNKQRIAIDMDEVLADPIGKFIDIYQREHGYTYTLDQMHGKEFRDLLPEELQPTLREYINRKGFFRDLELIPDSREVVEQLCQKYDVFIVSAAMEFPNSLEDKLHWLGDHFPFIPWTNIIFCGYKIVKADIMIDDRIRNFSGFDGRKLLFTSPHNIAITEYERVNTWDEVAVLLL